MNPSKINFAKIIFGLFIFLAIFGFVQLLKDNAKSQNRSVNQSLNTSPAGDAWPTGWVKWSDIFEGSSVIKYGPEFSETDFVINLPTSLISLLPGGSSCVGDSEVATCLVGESALVKEAYEEWSNLY